jgi:superfamily II DNA or RNA helicase
MTNNDINISEIKEKLLEYQIEHTLNIVRIIKTNKAALDASDTGTGKTYSAIAACKLLKLKPMIICPKSIVSVWKRVCEYFGVQYEFIVNYELIKRLKIYKENKKIKANFIKLIEKDDTVEYKFDFDKLDDKIFIFDEAHKCSNLNSDNGNLLVAAKKSLIPILVLSSTIADYPDKFKLFFYILNFIQPEQVKNFDIHYQKYIKIVEKWIERDQKPMVRIHNMLYPERATRVRIDVLGDAFPATQITATPYSLDKARTKEIELEYKKLNAELDVIKNKNDKDKLNPLTLLLRAQQRIEILKIPTFIELANDFIYNKFSVVIFVNFTQTLKTLSEMLKTDSVIYGEQSYEDRIRIIEEFQENKSNIIICNIKAGGIGISLHDIYGNHPRVSIISPTWNSIELTQALGRIHRAGGKSKSLQRIIYIADTVEERIADKLKLKLKNINSINNGDLDLTNIDFKNVREKI